MDHGPLTSRPLGRTGLMVSQIGYGAFKIGRNEQAKYAGAYALPTEQEASALLNAILDMGITLIDTAPAYGLSEERIGKAIAHRRSEFVLSTKAGELFENGRSRYDFSRAALRSSVEESLQRLRTSVIDILFIHSDGNDRHVLEQTDAVATMQDAKSRGLARGIGFSGKTVEGARLALDWADAIMIEYHSDDTLHADVIAEAGRRCVGVIVKKGLGSGRIAPQRAIPFVLGNAHVSSLVIGGLNPEHLRENLRVAESAQPGKR